MEDFTGGTSWVEACLVKNDDGGGDHHSCKSIHALAHT